MRSGLNRQNLCLLRIPEVILFGNKVSVNVINLRWCHSGLKWGLNLRTNVLKRRGGDTQTSKRRSCKDESRDWIYAVTNLGSPRFAGRHQKLGLSRKGFFSRLFRKSAILLTPWFQTFGFKRCERLNYFCCKLSSLCKFITAVLRN